MQDALRSTPLDNDPTSGRSSAGLKKILAAGVATVGAGAMAVAPMAPTVAADAAREAQERAVALTAAADPAEEAQDALSETLLNLGYLGSNTVTAYAAVAAAFQAANLPGELSNILLANLSNPLPLLERLAQAPSVYGDDLQIAFFGREDDPSTAANENYDGVFERYQLVGAEFEALLADLQNYDPPANDPEQGRFTNMAFELNNFFVFGVLDNLRPLIGATPSGIIPLFSIPGDFLGGVVDPTTNNPTGQNGGFDTPLPGVDRLDNLINVLNEQTFVRAAVGPFQTAFFQLAQSLDDITEAYEAGDTDLALNELSNVPVRVINAALNGFAPSFSPGGEEWPSFLDPRQQQSGLGKYLAVDLPNQIITALGGTPYVPQVPPAPAPTTARIASTDVSPSASLFSFDSASLGSEDDVTEEDVTEEDVTEEDVTEEDVTGDDATEDATEEDATEEDVTEEDVTEEDTTEEDVTEDDTTEDDADEDDADADDDDDDDKDADKGSEGDDDE